MPQTITRRRKQQKTSGRIFYFCMLAIPLLQFLVFYVYVNFQSIVMAFQYYNYSNGALTFGFDNFVYLWNNCLDQLLVCLKNSLIYFVFTVLMIPFSLIVSYYFYKRYRLHNFFKIIMFLPSIVCISAFVIIYMSLINKGVAPLFGESTILARTMSHPWAQFFLILFYLLLNFSANFLLYLNAMGQINPAVIEAAEVDGASEARIFFHIVIPQTWGTIVSLLLIFIAGICTNQAYLFTFFGNQAYEPYQTLGYWMFSHVTSSGYIKSQEFSFHIISSLGVFLTLILAPLTIGVRSVLLKYGPSED